ncbi:periplasmic chaperone for outer membrane proteins SurA [Paracoccus sulfuroxidans]|uniref:Parvulin-like PPIase n=2 Tax=Paracoccus sulfuroxidans TaxID=384678 RepID=A0A562NY83_9RHOB|nr:peptidylprolyl isomerase [Paracoccus sulfuroxidans]TWI36960.1 periplasmic chaperone for outer membrane proteins SurA [Paracoccus sulfuroxidans]
MRRILLGAAMAAMIAGSTVGPALSQGNPFQPLIYVNDSVVTRFELDQRVRFLQLLRAPEADAAAAEKALIDDRLRTFAAKQLGITASDEQIQAGLVEFANRGGMDVEQFTQALAQAGVEAQTFRDFVAAGVVWRAVVRQRVVPQVNVTDEEVEQAFTRVVQTPRVTTVALSELVIPAPEGREAAAMALAEQLSSSVRSESAFASAAREYSATPTAENGGRLPWTPLANLPPALRPLILSMQPGQISQPITVQSAVILFFLRDTRGTLRPGATDQVLEFLRVRLGSPELANRVASLSDTCDDVYTHLRAAPEAQIQRETLPQSAIPSDVGLRLAVMDDNEISLVNSGGAVDLVMLCKRSPALLAQMEAAKAAKALEAQSGPAAAQTGGEEGAAPDPDALPDLSAMRDEVFNTRISQAADAYLAELRANAIIRKP